ncbi:MAG: hypothetical protein NZ874_01195 [Fimbriimonadales bacterium]|nr:hypothetical protein [Fimbriimonadales bacterium]
MARLVSISEAAQLIGAQESIIHDWIQKGLLPSLRQEYYPSLPPGTLGILYRCTVELVDVDQLYEVAEEQGWLMLTAEAWDDDEAES